MEKIRNLADINESLIRGWKTPGLEQLLQSNTMEEDLLQAFENGLYNTPVEPKINPREMIYALTFEKKLSEDSIAEIKNITRIWVDMTTVTWNENVPPFFSTELDYILFRA